ncbi:hypothetical protein F2Q69_00018050 [Brassica cretica]|uniref:Uncharacterized protein n=1 Tax=Brassica cretica TaxID=69181 RepID=A0A8S9QU04_BRACR|nr:hypothetical protein F2Q69_00018050 [Brassica cretica]
METVGESTIPSLRDESDDEEEMERHAFRVEEDVAAFINEPPIRHNIYPDTETDSDTDEEKDEAMKDLKFKNVMIEFSSTEAAGALTNPLNHPWIIAINRMWQGLVHGGLVHSY